MSKEKKILVTGAKGFIGKNLVAELKNRQLGQVYEFDKESSFDDLGIFTRYCDFVFHLAGINRPQRVEEFREGNVDFTNDLLDMLRKHSNRAPVIFTSSTQAVMDNPYGRTKLEAENVLKAYSEDTGAPVIIYRLLNVFGKWCRPSYNSVVATFCHNIANNLPIQINDPNISLNLVYIDDVVNELLSKSVNINKSEGTELIENIRPIYSVTIGQLAEFIYSCQKSRVSRELPDLSSEFSKKLYATYLSYLPAEEFKYPLKMNIDYRGSFTEFLRTPERGQISVNISKPGIIKGNHWHHTKNEKFLVVSGHGVIRFRKIGTAGVLEYHVSGDKLEVVDIPPGYTHNIENLSTTDMVTLMWASEAFDPEKPDTLYEEV
jgi:UDP-2-acetamido-2,6-beta-L-arabino-hexul-4-ose reductase